MQIIQPGYTNIPRISPYTPGYFNIVLGWFLIMRHMEDKFVRDAQVYILPPAPCPLPPASFPLPPSPCPLPPAPMTSLTPLL